MMPCARAMKTCLITCLRRVLPLALSLGVVIETGSHVDAFEEPVHLSLTIWLAISAGFPESEAFQLGRFDQATDDDPSTSPMPLLNFEQRRLYHAFGGASAVRELEGLAHCTRDAITPLEFKGIGQFLHALEDLYSHRCCGPILGQLTIGEAPDKPWYAPPVFVEMVDRKFDQLLKLRRDCKSDRFSEQAVIGNFARSIALLDRWAGEAYEFSAEDENNEARWQQLIRARYGVNYVKYTDTFVKNYRGSQQVPVVPASPSPPTIRLE